VLRDFGTLKRCPALSDRANPKSRVVLGPKWALYINQKSLDLTPHQGDSSIILVQKVNEIAQAKCLPCSTVLVCVSGVCIYMGKTHAALAPMAGP
jgi:hypothetical protein